MPKYLFLNRSYVKGSWRYISLTICPIADKDNFASQKITYWVFLYKILCHWPGPWKSRKSYLFFQCWPLNFLIFKFQSSPDTHSFQESQCPVSAESPCNDGILWNVWECELKKQIKKKKPVNLFSSHLEIK